MRLRSLVSRHGWALAAAAVPCLLWLAPVLRHPAHTVVGAEGDNLYYVHQFWWMKHALLDLRRSPFFDPGSYVPLGYSMSRGELTPANTLLALPVTTIAGPIAAYNLMVLASFLLTAWATYAWVYRLTGSRGGGLVAAVVAAMAPYRLAHAAGHLPLITTQGLSLALWTLEEMRAALIQADPRRRQALGWALAMGASVALTALSSWYYAYSLALMFPLYLVLRTSGRRDLWRSRVWWQGLAVALAAAGLLVAPFAVPYIHASIDGTLRRTFVETDSWSLNFYDFFIPTMKHPLWMGWGAHAFPQEWDQWVERTVSLGYVATALAIVAIARLRKTAGETLIALCGVAVISGLFALGLVVHSGGHAVLLRMPWLVTKTADWLFFRIRPLSPFRAELWSRQVSWIPLPSLFLFLFVPGAGGMRSFARFGYWTLLMTAALAAFGVRELYAGAFGLTRRAAHVVVALILCGVVFESWTARFPSTWAPRPVDVWVASQPLTDVVVELPLRDTLRPAQDYYATIEQHPQIFGPRGDSFQPPVLRERTGVVAVLPSDASLASLREWGATILIVHQAHVPDWPAWASALTRAGAAPVAAFGEIRVYRFPR